MHLCLVLVFAHCCLCLLWQFSSNFVYVTTVESFYFSVRYWLGKYIGLLLDLAVLLKVLEKNKADAARFSPFWNEIIKNLREEDYMTTLWVSQVSLVVTFFLLILVFHIIKFAWILHFFTHFINTAWREMELLLMPRNTGNLPLVQWPLFLLASKVSHFYLFHSMTLDLTYLFWLACCVIILEVYLHYTSEYFVIHADISG